MKKLAKFIRIITISPMMVVLFLTLVAFKEPTLFYNTFHIIIAYITLGILPVLAYPIQARFHIIKGEKRASERRLAVYFSVIGYAIGFLFSLLYKVPNFERIYYLTYMLSGLLIFILSYRFHIMASGHMAGLSGPIAIMIILFGPWYYVFCLLYISVVVASLMLKRHTPIELLLGTLIPISSMFLSILMIGPLH